MSISIGVRSEDLRSCIGSGWQSGSWKEGRGGVTVWSRGLSISSSSSSTGKNWCSVFACRLGKAWGQENT